MIDVKFVLAVQKNKTTKIHFRNGENFMSYVKNYNAGSIKLDAPYTHFIYELPMLSFGDIQHNVNLSLVYLSKATDDLYNIAIGYKLNLQKKAIKSTVTGYLTDFEEGNGARVKLIGCGTTGSDVYLFDDKSKRIIRKTSTGFTLENSDYSKEIYDDHGNILKIIDKYGNTVFTYEYVTDTTRLDRIIYRENLKTSDGTYKRVLKLSYTTENKLSDIKYIFDGVEQCKFDFVYNGSELTTIKSPSGVNYTITKDSELFSVCSHDDDATYSATVNHYQKIACQHPLSGTITMENFIGEKVVDKTIYHPMASISDDKCEVWDIESFTGVRKRILFNGDYPTYSYEVTADSTSGYDAKFAYNNKYYGKVSYYNNDKVIGGQSYDDGLFMTLGTDKIWLRGLSTGTGITGLFTLSGWIKTPDINMDCTFKVYDQTIATAIPFTVKNYCAGMWTYFTFVFYGENFRNIRVHTDCSSYGLEMKDFRITYQELNLLSTDATKHFINAEDVLINSAGDIIPFRDVSFAYFKAGSFITINEYVSGGDIIKYQLNSKKTGAVNDEVYYNDVKGVITNATDLRVRYNGTDLNISNYSVGKRYDSNSKIYVTKFITNPPESTAWFKTQTICDGTIVSVDLYDEYMNVFSSSKENVTVAYKRNSVGLVTKKTTGNIAIECAYDDTLSKLLWSKDEFNTKTIYTTDDAWGAVTKSVVTDSYGNVVVEKEETFDSDYTDKLSTKFQKGNESKTNSYTYENDKLKTITGGELEYSFSYEHNYTHSITDSNGNAFSDSSRLVGISKFGSPIEQNVYRDDHRKVTTAYPSLTSPLYTVVERLDKYGRIERIDGKVKNTYDALPYYSKYVTGEFGTVGDSGETALLAVSEDLMTGKKTKFGYKADQLKIAAVFNSSGTKLTTESFEYDNINRMTSDEFTYETGKSVKSQIEYDTATTDINPDNRIKNYSYTVNGTEKAKTQNRYYDNYKRLTAKLVTMGGYTYDKGLTYSKTRISKVMDVKNGSTFHNVSYGYDALGRIISEADSVDTSFNNTYVYDTFGRLIQENNKALDKTFVFKYNDNGNIIGCDTLAYTTANVSNANVTVTHVYDSTIKDRLVKFNNNPISYDENGCPTSYNGKTYTWTKGKLTSVSSGTIPYGTNNYTYVYDAYGRRTQKNQSMLSLSGSIPSNITINTSYDYDTSGRLIRETILSCYTIGNFITTEKLYLYDESGVIGMIYTDNDISSTYYFDRNIRGDVIGIFDSTGARIAKYSYDAWGNCTISSTTNSTIANANPFRYRGYYYDAESGFYFLNARYYNPAWRRFISPDDTAYLDPETPNGLNLYAYCNNDPVNYADPNGHFVITLFAVFVAAAIGFGC